MFRAKCDTTQAPPELANSILTNLVLPDYNNSYHSPVNPAFTCPLVVNQEAAEKQFRKFNFKVSFVNGKNVVGEQKVRAS